MKNQWYIIERELWGQTKYLSDYDSYGNLRWSSTNADAVKFSTKKDANKRLSFCEKHRDFLLKGDENFSIRKISKKDIELDNRPRCCDCGRLLTPEEIDMYGGSSCRRCHEAFY